MTQDELYNLMVKAGADPDTYKRYYIIDKEDMMKVTKEIKRQVLEELIKYYNDFTEGILRTCDLEQRIKDL